MRGVTSPNLLLCHPPLHSLSPACTCRIRIRTGMLRRRNTQSHYTHRSPGFLQLPERKATSLANIVAKSLTTCNSSQLTWIYTKSRPKLAITDLDPRLITMMCRAIESYLLMNLHTPKKLRKDRCRWKLEKGILSNVGLHKNRNAKGNSLEQNRYDRDMSKWHDNALSGQSNRN